MIRYDFLISSVPFKDTEQDLYSLLTEKRDMLGIINPSWPEYDEINSWLDLDYDDLVNSIDSVEDVVCYLIMSNYEFGGDWCYSANVSDYVWNYHSAAELVWKYNSGDCGNTSALTAGLLNDDFDEVGVIELQYAQEGGHVINYIYDGNQYYVFDMVNLSEKIDPNGFCYSYGASLQEAADKWAEKTYDTVTMMIACDTDDTDCPIGYKSDIYEYVAIQMENKVQILRESPKYDAVYKFAEISDSDWNKLKNLAYQNS